MAVAEIAWRDLSPEARKAASDILRQHPFYDADLVGDMPGDFPDKDLYAFMKAATWPDIIRDTRHPRNHELNHPTWHYVDIPYAPEGAGVTPPTPDLSSWQSGAEPANVVQGIEKALHDLKDPATTPEERALALCWYLHLAGDIHQPLHATTLYSQDYPEGDKGGNAMFFYVRGTRLNLHAFWDGLLGDYPIPQAFAAVVDTLEQRHPRAAFAGQLKVTDPAEWAKESHAAGIESAYLNGRLRGVPNTVLDRNPQMQLPPPPAGYEANARKVGFERMTLAGYRIADGLNGILSPQSLPAPAAAPTVAR